MKTINANPAVGRHYKGTLDMRGIERKREEIKRERLAQERKGDIREAIAAKAATPVEVIEARKRLVKAIDIAKKKGQTERVRLLVLGMITV